MASSRGWEKGGEQRGGGGRRTRLCLRMSWTELRDETRGKKERGRAAVASPDTDVVYGSLPSASNCADRALVASGGNA